MRSLILASVLFAAVLAVSGTPTTAHALSAAARTVLTLEVREWSAPAVAKHDGGCNSSHAGCPGDPVPELYCKFTFGNSAPCCVENSVGGVSRGESVNEGESGYRTGSRLCSALETNAVSS
ncbi:hypothetical protein C8T65DRAFT_728018 [Cerioporus squamosus]|nr:hypothetical protein C8T65DRAFT_728018 [Cerioporus squamosus]